MNDHPALTLPAIRQALADHAPRILPVDRTHAAVALILHPAACGPELLFILRAPWEGDPWSGDIGFPGGRLDPGDAGPRQAAERETAEEVGLDLKQAEPLGRLNDLYGATLPVLISCFVYVFRQRPALRLNQEIADFFWFPLPELTNSERHHPARLSYRGRQIEVPAVDLLGDDGTVLWGITYRLIDGFFEILGIPFGGTSSGACRYEIFR